MLPQAKSAGGIYDFTPLDYFGWAPFGRLAQYWLAVRTARRNHSNQHGSNKHTPCGSGSMRWRLLRQA